MATKVMNGLDLQNRPIVSLGTPTADTDAATKAYVDSVARGLDWKDAVVAASTGNVTISSAPSSIDTVTLAAGDRVLLKDQSATSENGIYVFSAASSPLVRAEDANADAEVTSGLAVSVVGGSANANKLYVLTTEDPIVLDTTPLSFAQVGGAGTTITAGAGLTGTTTFNVGEGDGINVAADAVSVDAGAGLTFTAGALVVGAGNGITASADAIAVDAGDGIVVDGTGVGIALAPSNSRLLLTGGVLSVDPSTVPRKVAQDIGDATNTTITVTHSLNTYDVHVEVFTNSGTRDTVLCDVTRNGLNTVQLSFATPPTTGQYRVVIIG